MDYLKYWDLTQKPFEELGNPIFFYESSDHREALDRLLYITNDKNMGIGLLTGEIGSGKTLTKKVLERSISKNAYDVVSVDSYGLKFNDLLYDVARKISFNGVNFEMSVEEIQDKRDDRYYLIDTFTSYLRHLNEREQRHFIMIVDEAQQLDVETLDQIKNLSNIGTDERNYLTIILIGQPELRETIRNLKQLDQRVSLRFHLNNLDKRDVGKYVCHRLRIAGCPRENVFSPESIDLIYKDSGGVPREVNRTCKLALHHAAAIEAKEVSADTIQLIIEDIHKHR